MNKAIVVLTNVPDAEVAESIAKELVDGQLAACVNILPGIRSIYRWQGLVEEAEEVTLLIKTTDVLYQDLEEAITDLHPYDIPEIVALPAVGVLPAYLAWMNAETSVEQEKEEDDSV